MKTKYKGIFYIILSALCFAFMSAFVRLSGELPFVQKCFFRNFVAFFFALGIMIKNNEPIKIRKKYLPDLLGRAVMGTVGMFCNFYAVDIWCFPMPQCSIRCHRFLPLYFRLYF